MLGVVGHRYDDSWSTTANAEKKRLIIIRALFFRLIVVLIVPEHTGPGDLVVAGQGVLVLRGHVEGGLLPVQGVVGLDAAFPDAQLEDGGEVAVVGRVLIVERGDVVEEALELFRETFEHQSMVHFFLHRSDLEKSDAD